ncbi:hypothetical protein [Halomonas sp. hl-4]|uniref:hypothetical protein n=1 Tax=Halomonas sp. hl-4 TaxID=1761789 RepID=UPI000BB812DF|nr:hypothetical protein [Halomonas sp. hl-4]SNY97918.1 hypothetical protein SAMN04488142_2527 [Halomonas sp. hl-4]
MLIKMLPVDERDHILDLASLMAIADKPILWDGKTYDEITTETSLDLITLEVSEDDRELIADLERSARMNSHFIFETRDLAGITNRLIEVFKKYPFTKMEHPNTRVRAATTLMTELIEKKNYDDPSIPKIFLYELFLVSLRDGKISGVEWALLKEFQRHHKLEDFIFDDLLERAETLNKEITSTISIILE